MNFIKFDKQHNWEYADAAFNPDKSQRITSEKRDSYNYKGNVEINRLP